MNMTNVVTQLNEISSAIMYATEGLDLEDVLKRIAEVSCNLVQCKYGALGIPDARGGLRYFKTTGITDEQAAMIDHLPKGHGLIRAPMRDREIIRLARMQDDDRSVGFPENHPFMTSLLGVPIQMGDQLFGVLYLCDRIDGQPFTEEDQNLIETMAGYAALTIVSAMSSDHQSRLKVLEERERIGMELHDGVIQSLYALGMQLDLLRMGDDLQPDELKPVIHGLDTVIGDIRRYIMQLRTAGDSQKTIHQCLQEMADKLNMSDSLQVEIQASQTYPPFAPATFEGICLIITEAMSNAIRHAHASLLHVSAEVDGNRFNVTVNDNGEGFDIASIGEKGLGLNNMHKRARIYGGTVDVQSVIGEGTTLVISVPIKSF